MTFEVDRELIDLDTHMLPTPYDFHNLTICLRKYGISAERLDHRPHKKSGAHLSAPLVRLA